MTKRTKKSMSNIVLDEESYSYDAAGNITDAPESCFEYDTNNRLVSAGDHSYTYNAEDVRIRNLHAGQDTTYTYDTNCNLSKLLCKTTNNVTTKYVYGHGLLFSRIV